MSFDLTEFRPCSATAVPAESLRSARSARSPWPAMAASASCCVNPSFVHLPDASPSSSLRTSPGVRKLRRPHLSSCGASPRPLDDRPRDALSVGRAPRGQRVRRRLGRASSRARGHRVVIAAPSAGREPSAQRSQAAIDGGRGPAPRASSAAAGSGERVGRRRAAGRSSVGPASRCPAGRSRAPLPSRSTSPRSLEGLLSAVDFDIVHVHDPFAPSAASAALRHSRALNVATFHLPTERVLSTQVARPLVEIFFGRLDARTVTGAATAELLERFFPGSYEILEPAAEVGSRASRRRRTTRRRGSSTGARGARRAAPAAAGAAAAAARPSPGRPTSGSRIRRSRRRGSTAPLRERVRILRAGEADPAELLAGRRRRLRRLGRPSAGAEPDPVRPSPLPARPGRLPDRALRGAARAGRAVRARVPARRRDHPRRPARAAARDPALRERMGAAGRESAGPLLARSRDELEEIYGRIARPPPRPGGQPRGAPARSRAGGRSTATCTCTPTTRTTARPRSRSCSRRRRTAAWGRSRSPTTTRSPAHSRRGRPPSATAGSR